MKDEQYTGMTPAALQAAMKGDIENFITAITPGGIEAQEAAGQRDLVQSGKLPKRGTVEAYMREDNRQGLEALGFVFRKAIDDLFVACTLPAGWSIKATSHAMWSTVFDSLDRERMRVFYKAAFYDRDAFLTVIARYHINVHRAATLDMPEVETSTQEEWREALRCYYVADYDETPIFLGEAFRTGDFAADKERYQICEDWLLEHYPDYRNPFAYWEK